MPMLGPMTPYHQLILAAQYQQQQQQILQHPRPQIASQDFFETMQRFIQLRNAGTLSNDNAPTAPTGGNLKGPSTPTSEAAFKKDTVDTTASPASPKPPMASNLPHSPALNLLQPHPLPVATSSPEPLITQNMPHLPQLPPLPLPQFLENKNSMALNNNHLVPKSEDELKREEEMVEDEMKEEEDELDDNEDVIAEENKTEANSEKDHNLVNEKSGPPPVQGFLSSENFKQIQLNWLKKMYEDLQKNKGTVPLSDISAGKLQFQSFLLSMYFRSIIRKLLVLRS